MPLRVGGMLPGTPSGARVGQSHVEGLLAADERVKS